MRFLAWGSNIARALDPNSADQIIKEPRDVSLECEKILWVGWAETVVQTSSGVRTWGSSKDFAFGPTKRVLGFDKIAAYLDDKGHVCDFTRTSTTMWDDVTISGLGVVYAFRRHDGLYRFASLQDFFDDTSARIIHPAFNPTHPATLYSMESRAFVHSAGPMHQLFEVSETLDLIEDLEGMEFSIVPGSCNRLGIVTDAGSAYVLEKRSQEVELLEAPGDVRLLGLGSDFDVVVVENEVLVRGNSE